LFPDIIACVRLTGSAIHQFILNILATAKNYFYTAVSRIGRTRYGVILNPKEMNMDLTLRSEKKKVKKNNPYNYI
jgi:hypothetical protein